MSESARSDQVADQPAEDVVVHDDVDDESEDEAGAGPAAGSRRQQLEAEGDVAADYLEELLDIADLDGDIDTYTEGGRAHVSIVTDSEELVGHDGEVLEALQELVRLAVMTETGNRSRLMLDIAGYRDKQRKRLRLLAEDAIAEVKASGEAVALAPMNPFERKIVHDTVAEAGLVSESEGVEPRRHVVIRPA
ncbi:MAG: protein jag [Propionibacterium sp.]|nr:protein jag [Propionibacterium sp.]